MIGKIFPRKLNKESDPSLIKPDEMLDALNVLASGSEGNDASIVKKAHGNKEVTANDAANTFAVFNGLPTSEDVVGHVVDDSSNRIYYFTKSDNTNSVYMAEKFSEEEIKVTLLLRDADLGFEKYVAADVIKTPKKTVQSLFLDGDVSGESGDSTSIFDFEADDSTTEIIENQTALIVSTAPQIFTNPIYDGDAKTFFGQMAIKNLGSEPGEANLSYSHDTGAIENYTFSYDISGSDTANVQVEGGATVIINFRLDFVANIPEEDGLYKFNIFVEEVPTPFTQTPLDVSFLRTINFQFVLPSYPFQLQVTPIIAGVGAVDGDVANFVQEVAFQGTVGAMGGMACPESNFAQYFGILQVEVTLDNPPSESLYFLPEMSVRAAMIGGTDGNYTGSNQGFFFDVGSIYNGDDPMMIIEFPLTAESFAGGTTAIVNIPFGKSWDTSSGLEGEVITGTMSVSVVNGETGQAFGMLVPGDEFGTSVAVDDSPHGWMLASLDYDYTIANVPTPASVSAVNQFNEFVNIPSRSYSIMEDGQVGGGFKYFEFGVVNTGESDGYFNVSIDPFQTVHKELRQIVSSSGDVGGAYNAMNNTFKSLYDAISIDITTDQGTSTGLKPSFRTTFSDILDPTGETNQPFDFFDFINYNPANANVGFTWHASASDQHQILLEAGKTGTVRINISNESLSTWPKIPLPISDIDPASGDFKGKFGTWNVGVSDFISGGAGGEHHGLIVYPKTATFDYPFANYDRLEASWSRDSFDSATSFAQDLAAAGNGVSQSYKDRILASPLLTNVMSFVSLRTTSSQTGNFSGEVINAAGKMYVSTDSPTRGEVLVLACGNYADPGTNLVIGGAQLPSNTPLLNSYMPHDASETLPPTAVVQNANNTAQSTKGNIYRETTSSALSAIPTMSINHHGREVGAPMGFYILNIGLQKNGLSGTVEITGTPQYNNAYGLNGPHGATTVQGIFAGTNIDLSGSIGTSYAGAYIAPDTDAMEASDGLYVWAQIGGLNGTGGPSGGSSVGVRDFFRGHNGSVSTNFIQEGGPYAVLPQSNSGLELNSNDGTSITWGVYRRISQTMSQGSALYVEPVHMISYNFHDQGQRDPSVDETSLSDTSGIVTGYTISVNGFENDDASSSDNLCWEQTHENIAMLGYHSAGQAATAGGGGGGGGGGVTPFSPPPVSSGDRSTSLPISSIESSSSNSVNLPSNTSGTDPQRDDVNKKSKRRTQVGLSSKKKKRY